MAKGMARTASDSGRKWPAIGTSFPLRCLGEVDFEVGIFVDKFGYCMMKKALHALKHMTSYFNTKNDSGYMYIHMYMSVKLFLVNTTVIYHWYHRTLFQKPLIYNSIIYTNMIQYIYIDVTNGFLQPSCGPGPLPPDLPVFGFPHWQVVDYVPERDLGAWITEAKEEVYATCDACLEKHPKKNIEVFWDLKKWGVFFLFRCFFLKMIVFCGTFGTRKVNAYSFIFRLIFMCFFFVVVWFDVKHNFTLRIRLRSDFFRRVKCIYPGQCRNGYITYTCSVLCTIHDHVYACVFFCDILFFPCISVSILLWLFHVDPYQLLWQDCARYELCNSVSKTSKIFFRWKWTCDIFCTWIFCWEWIWIHFFV